MSLRTNADHTVDVTTPVEAREALEAADTLGLTLRDVVVRGRWTAPQGEAEPSRATEWTLSDRTQDARKWFYLEGNGYDEFRGRPRDESNPLTRPAALELRFDSEGGA